jgi:hypothetical protein
MGLSNAASRARNYDQTINRDWLGGGNKKAGFPYQVGRTMWSTIALGGDNVGNCCGLPSLKITKNPRVRLSRPMGSTVNVPYWVNGAHY